MSKLFDVPAKEVDYIIELETYKNNKVFNKIVEVLKNDGIYKVKKLRRDDDESSSYEVSAKSKVSRRDFVKEFINELVALIPDTFPSNYSFDFTGEALGFTRSFIVYEMDDKNTKYGVSHRIKEIRTNGESKAPKQVIIPRRF